MKKHSRLRTALIVVLILAAAAAGIAFAVWKLHSSGTAEVMPVSSLAETYWGDTLTMEATVSAGSVQDVPMQSGLVSEIRVKQGDSVKAGDVLMVYDTTSYQLTLEKDDAAEAVLRSQITQVQNQISTLQSLKPSESTPAPVEITVPGTVTAPDTVSEVTETTAFTGTGTEDDPRVYLCTADTVVTSAALRSLGTACAEFRMYDGIALLGFWTIDGADTADAQTDWVLGNGITFCGDGTSELNLSAMPGFGTLTTCIPNYDDGSYTYEKITEPDEKGNYAYTRAELAQMISDAQAQLADLQLSLQQAVVTGKKDRLTAETGEVLAAQDGTVTYVGDASTASEGETLITVKGTAAGSVIVYVGEMNLSEIAVGDTMEVQAYESGSYFTATVTEIGTTPADGTYMYGSENPNSSYYPVLCTPDDADVELSVGEWCEASLASDTESENFYLPLSYVREDSSGSYVMAADENDRLEKRYISTGRNMDGYAIEIKAGLTWDDRITFPYGKTAKVGMPVVDTDSEVSYYY